MQRSVLLPLINIGLELCYAFHEAGHVVVGFVTGHKVLRASIKPTTTAGGHIDIRLLINENRRYYDIRNLRKDCRRDMQMIVAGEAAEHRYFGDRGLPVPGLPVSDWRLTANVMARANAYSLSRRLGPALIWDDYLNTRQITMEMMYEPKIWEGIEAIAKALRSEKELTYWQIRNIIHTVQRPFLSL